MDYLELHFSEIMQFKVEKQIHFELISTNTSRDEVGKLSGQHGQGRVKLTGIQLHLLTPSKNLNSVELYSQQPILLVL